MMEKAPSNKHGRPRVPRLATESGVRASADDGLFVNQGRRAGQLKSARGQGGVRRPISGLSPTAQRREKAESEGLSQAGGEAFGRIRSAPEAEAEAEKRRIRVVHQHKGPYRTIQAALSEALDGDIISVSPGVYAEQLKIERDNVRIVGKARDGGEVVLECSSQAWTVRVERDAGNYRLENIIFRQRAEDEAGASAAAKAGIAALQDNVKRNMFALAQAEKEREHHDSSQGGFAAIVARGRLTFLNCTFAAQCGGVLILGSDAESLIFGCRFSAAPAGSAAVQVEERARARIRRCTFENCIGMGVQIVNSECTIDDNTFSDMYNYSIQIAKNSASTIRGNTFATGRKASVAISGSSAPLIEKNVFSKSYATGVFIFDSGRPTVEANEFKECVLAAIEARDEGSDPMIVNNVIADGSDGAIVVHNKARGTVKGNTISGNRKAGITLCTGAAAIVVENSILNGMGSGILCHSDAGGVVRANRISQTAKAGIELRKRASTQVLGNVITGGLAQGIHVHTDGMGHFECNQISKCKGPLVEVSGSSSSPTFKDNELVGGVGGGAGFVVCEGAAPVLQGNLFKECAKAGIHISSGANPEVRGNKMYACAQQSVVVNGHEVKSCVIQDNEIMGSQGAGIDVSNGAAPSVSRNVIERGNGSGIYVHDEGGGTYTGNSLRLNSKAGISVKTRAEVVLAGNSILDGKATGVYVYDDGKVHMKEGNKIERNAFHGVAVRDGGVLSVSGCKIVKSGQNGIFVYAKVRFCRVACVRESECV